MKKRSELNPRWTRGLLTVDPGFDGTGWAYWVGNEFPITGVIRESRKVKCRSHEDRLNLLYTEFRILLRQYDIDHLLLESMELWTNSRASMASASSGDLFLLQTLVGGFTGVSASLSTPFSLITPRKWKGQLSKEAVESRIQLINGTKYPNHICDAVGMGFHAAGIL